MRIVLIFMLLTLFIAATVPTGYFSSGDRGFQDLPSDEKHKFMSSPAICYFKLDSGTWDLWGPAVSMSSVTASGSFQSMAVSALLLLAGFFTKTVKMSRRLSQSLTGSIRRPISHYSQILLLKVSARNGQNGQTALWQRMWHVLIIQPCLAFFIAARIIADTYSSFFTEVSTHDTQ